MIVRKIIQFNTFQIITVSKMLPFAFEKSTPKEENITSTQQNLLARILMLTLQNQRLTKLHNNAQYNSKEYSFSNHSSNEISSNQFKLQMELKKIETDNLTIQINELQQKCIVQESKIHEQQNAYYVYQTTIKDETTQIKAQLQLYKNKYEEELLQRNQYQKKTIQLQKFINQYKQREQELIQKNNAFRNQQNNLVRIKQKSIDELEKKIKELKKELAVLKQNCIQKEQECFELRQNLKDAPKIEELNRWILKVRQYEEKQLQSCGKISQMSQQICGLKEKNRKLQHQYKQMLKIKQELQQSVTASRQNEDSMTVYFQRLSTYEKVIRDLQEEVKTLQNSNKIMQTKCNEKLVTLEQQKNNAVTQWQAIVQEMNKQRSLLHAMQNQLDQYTNIKQNIMVKVSQPPSQMETSSRIIETKITDVSGKQSFISKYPSLENTNRLSREEGRVNSHKIIYHSDRINHSFSRLQTQNSQNCNDSFSKESGCRDCQSRGKVARSISSGRVPYQQAFRDQKQQKLILKDRENNLAINDSKQLLLDKLNYLKPQQDRLRITQRSLHSMHNKNMRHINNSYHSNIGNIFKNQPSSKLAISKPKEVATQKQNMNDMVFRKYSHLINRI